MHMFARFDENPANTLQDILGKKMLRTDGRKRRHTDRQRENSIPTTNKVWGVIKTKFAPGIIMYLFLSKLVFVLANSVDSVK